MTKPQSQDQLDELGRQIRSVIGEYGAFNHMGVAESNTVVLGVKALISTAVAEALERVEREVIGRQKRYKDGGYGFWCGESSLRRRQRTTLSKIKAEYTKEGK